jgi:ABC-2 type transport system permease protein
MRAFVAFFKKEITESVRSGKLLILTILFAAFGIMNPAIAKLTPWLLTAMADTLGESGITVTEITVSAVDSWLQFYKNMPIALIALLLLESAAFTKEYSSGTLALSLTKGLSRTEALLSKTSVLLALWTLGFSLCFSVTYAYNAFLWDNAAAKHLALSAIAWWLFGVLSVSLLVLFSALADTGSGVLFGTGATILVFYLLSLIPKAGRWLPTRLTEGAALVSGKAPPSNFLIALSVTAVLSLLSIALAIPLLSKKRL